MFRSKRWRPIKKWSYLFFLPLACPVFSCAHSLFLTNSRTPMHIHSHSLSLSHTHTYTHSLSLSLKTIHTLSLTCYRTHTHTHTHTHYQPLSLRTAHSHFKRSFFFLSTTPYSSFCVNPTVNPQFLFLFTSLTRTHNLTHTHSHSQTLTHNLTHTHTQSHLKLGTSTRTWDPGVARVAIRQFSQLRRKKLQTKKKF